MSMPQYIEIAVFASNETTLYSITKGTHIPEYGIAPRYRLVSLSDAPEMHIYSCVEFEAQRVLKSGKRVYTFAEFDTRRILLWIALDDNAKKVCEDAHQKNSNRTDYNR